MAAKRTRTPTQREAQLEAVSAGYLSGMTQAKIAERLGCARQQITYDLGILRKRWRQRSDMQFDRALSEEVAKIDNLEAEYWAAWERSKQPREQTLSEQRQGQTAQTRAQVVRRERDGSAYFLLGVQWCIEKRCRLMGLEQGAAERQSNVVDLQQLLALARARNAQAAIEDSNRDQLAIEAHAIRVEDDQDEE